MADPITTPQDTPPAGGTATPPAPAPAPGAAVDWEARYKGMVKVLADKDTEIAQLKSQFDTTAGTAKSVQDQMAAAQAQWDAQKQAYDAKVKELTDGKDKDAKSLAEANAYKLKMEALRAYPDLLPLADTIPAMPDADTMKKHLETLQAGVNAVAQQKVKALTAGLTPGPATPPPPPASKYSFDTEAEWSKALKDAAGKKEFGEISQAYKDWFTRKLAG